MSAALVVLLLLWRLQLVNEIRENAQSDANPIVGFVSTFILAPLPNQAARQLSDLSTIIRVQPSSTDDSRLQGALPGSDTPRA
jgi:hypothetical protein